MDILTFDQLPQGGFAGLIERQFVKDRKVFTQSGQGKAFNGIGNFVYLADANFLPHGETGMHGHKEIDVISVMVDGEISHAGSLEHGQSIKAGQAQAQRAGGEGFSHNEVNPNDSQNQMIQLWVLPEKADKRAEYKVYNPKNNELTTIYGGKSDQQDTLDSQTQIQVVNTDKPYDLSLNGESMAYLSRGSATVNGEDIPARTLVSVKDQLNFRSEEPVQLIIITEGLD